MRQRGALRDAQATSWIDVIGCKAPSKTAKRQEHALRADLFKPF